MSITNPTNPSGPFTEQDANTLTELTTYMKTMAVASVGMGNPLVTMVTTLGAALLDGITFVDGAPIGVLVDELDGFSKEDVDTIATGLMEFSKEQLAAAEVTDDEDTKVGLLHMSLSYFTAGSVISVSY